MRKTNNFLSDIHNINFSSVSILSEKTNSKPVIPLNGGIAIVDFLNLLRKPITDRPDAKFNTVEELIDYTTEISKEISKLGNFDYIYLVTKVFKFGNIKYKDVLSIILWSFYQSFSDPEYIKKICLITVNGINTQDKEADDRALFILYNELSMTHVCPITILSNDYFENIHTHFYRDVILNFYWAINIGESWKYSFFVDYYMKKSKKRSIIFNTYKGIFKQSSNTCCKKFMTVSPKTNEIKYIDVPTS